MPEDLLVVGGYGAVGRRVCTALAEWAPGRVVAAGRSPATARRFAEAVDGVRPARIDLSDASTFSDVLDSASTVVTCVNAPSSDLARACIRRGVHYVDLSPTDAHLRAIEAFDATAQRTGSTVVLSVGLSPGLTNLLVTDAMAALDHARRANVTVVLGLDDAFGPDTIRWMVDDALGTFVVRENGVGRAVRGFSDARTVDLPGLGPTRAYRVNLADQHVLARTTRLSSVATRLAYDVPWVTTSMAVLNRWNLFEPIVAALGPRRVARWIRVLPLGSDAFVAHASVEGTVDGRQSTVERWICGVDQARVTARVAAAVCRVLETRPMDGGVSHLHDVMTLQSISPILDRWDDEFGATTTNR